MAKRKQALRSKRRSGGRSKDEVWAESTQVMRPIPLNSTYTMHKFVLTSPGPSAIQGNIVAPQFYGSAITISSFAAYSNLLAVYDQYRIDKVEVRIVLRNNPGAGLALPRISYFPDFDDATPPPSLSAVYSHPRVQTHVFSEAHPEVKFTFEPRVALPAYNGGAFAGYVASSQPMFCDSNTSNTQHYGYKQSIENFIDTTQYLDVYLKGWITMRNPL
jgi:hypothetical protein